MATWSRVSVGTSNTKTLPYLIVLFHSLTATLTEMGYCSGRLSLNFYKALDIEPECETRLLESIYLFVSLTQELIDIKILYHQNSLIPH